MQKYNLNQNWEFQNLSSGISATVNVPHDATISAKRDPGIRNGFLSAYFHGVKCRYKRKFFISKEYKEKALYLEFEGVYRDFTVKINEKEVYRQRFGYIPCHIRLDDFVQFGQENEICVDIDTPEESHNRWYAGSGIYQDVNLYVGEKTHIKMYGVRVTTLSTAPAKIAVEVDVVEESQNRPEVTIDILDGSNTVACSSGTYAEIDIPNAHLWSDDMPYLYQAKVTLLRDGVSYEERLETFGIRTLSWCAEEGFLVNGKRTLLRGGCIHNDNGVIGMVTNRVTEERRIKNLKASGFNALRSAHHPMSPALLEMCDKYGMYVMDESFDTWYRLKQRNGIHSNFTEYYESVTETMVRKDYNHPSVILYSIGNEIIEMGSLKGVMLAKQMLKIIRSIDTSRPTVLCPSMHMARSFLRDTPYSTMHEDEYLAQGEEYIQKDRENFSALYMKVISNIPDKNADPYPQDIVEEDEAVTLPLYNELDIAGYNYYTDKFEQLHKLHPERVLLGTETRGQLIYNNWNFIKEHTYAIGDFIWTLQDHIGEANVGGITYSTGKSAQIMEGRDYPWLLNDGGVVDLLGHMLPAIHKFRFCWGDYHGIYLASQPPVHDGSEPVYRCYKWTDTIESWSYEGYEGKRGFIDVYSDAYEVEVLINKTSVGRKQPKEYFAKFPCVYEPGEVTGIGYNKDGEEIYRNSLKSAGKEPQILLTPDKTELIAGGTDFCFINVDVTDKAGIIKALPERKVTIQVEGAGTLQGFGSASPITEESFCDNEHTTYHGRLLAVIRSGNMPGHITITAESEGQKEIIHCICK